MLRQSGRRHTNIKHKHFRQSERYGKGAGEGRSHSGRSRASGAKKITRYLQQRVQDSLDVYMKVCRQYYICGRPGAERIGETVDRLIREASQLQHLTDHESLITSYVLYDKAIRLVLGAL
ncbi:ORF6 [Betabaculovirus altermyunipunctae]|uniref:ORF6 n=1 Tax=Betabaculovirus altermyunipunctae TaxID=3051996 RepID=A0A1S5YE51_9BBAC|nr:ORF6 [Betabaculovirus altermyunipunctae]AQQ80276.1 ORF6 [Betabaculovirus altermyunipunctae]